MWRHFFDRFDPVAFSLGPVSISWYGICFLTGAIASLSTVWFLMYRRGEYARSSNEFFDLSATLLLGALIGARLGYAALYHASFFLMHPLALVSPFDIRTGEWIGIAGMSVHGGVIGVVVALRIFVKKRQRSFWLFADALALAAPIALFFGRIGNFLSGELYGRLTTVSWGMVFPRAGDGLPRHPSALYEALGEGLFLWILLFVLPRRRLAPGLTFAWAIGLYGIIRFFLEYFREPDVQIGFLFERFTFGQALSAGMITLSVGIGWWIGVKKGVILGHTRQGESVKENIF